MWWKKRALTELHHPKFFSLTYSQEAYSRNNRYHSKYTLYFTVFTLLKCDGMSLINVKQSGMSANIDLCSTWLLSNGIRQYSSTFKGLSTLTFHKWPLTRIEKGNFSYQTFDHYFTTFSKAGKSFPMQQWKLYLVVVAYISSWFPSPYWHQVAHK